MVLSVAVTDTDTVWLGDLVAEGETRLGSSEADAPNGIACHGWSKAI